MVNDNDTLHNDDTLHNTGEGVEEERLSKRNLWSFSLGAIGRDMAYTLFNVYLFSYIIFTKNLNAGQFVAVNAIIVACRIFDAINDPIMGTIIENTRTRIGKYKPWMLAGAISCSAVIIAAFSTSIDGGSFVAYLAAIYLLFSITYTMNDISFYSMLPSLSTSEGARNRLTSMTNLFAGGGAAIMSFLVPLLTAGALATSLFGNAPHAYRITAIFAAVMFIAFQLLTIFGVKEKPLSPLITADGNSSKVGLRKMFKIIKGNDQLLWVALVSLIFNTAGSLALTLPSTYIYFEFGYNGVLLTLFNVLFGLVGAATLITFPMISKKFSRKKLLFSAIIGLITGYALLLLFGIVFPSSQPVLKFVMMMIGNVFNGYGQTVFLLILTVSLLNTVEYNEWKTGDRNESIIFSIKPFMTKLGSAFTQLGVALIFLIIGVTDFTNRISDIENTLLSDDAKTNAINAITTSVPDAKKIALLVCMTVIPALLMSLAYALYKRKYKIDEKKYAEMLSDIKQRQENPD
ncbi:MAG: glycoside-pentoside-hexuronide (GPH):cation symporter [Clostridiales bacterium]|jgi:melibiose permease/lactose/raffinose/galactose permease|nr:glycoside-pentoside-hexuronide (GPH):cation symporter [Clostridiales bacterium]